MRHRVARGFTLIEILTVVVILGIAGAIIVPQINSRDDLKTASAARMLMADLIYAQNQAITLQRNQYVVFDTTAQTYTLVDSAGMVTLVNPVSNDPYVVTFGPSGTKGLENTQMISVSFTGQGGTTALTIGFDEMGTPLIYTAGATQTLTAGSVVLQTATDKLQVAIEPFTGLITVNPTN